MDVGSAGIAGAFSGHVRSHRKITPPLDSSEGEVGATPNQQWGSAQVT